LIGHSFFILDKNEKIETKVQSAFFKNIIPLLQEYFYGDYNKIGLVLGSGFVTKTKVENHKELFANSKDFNGNDYVGGDSHNYKIAEFKDNIYFFKALDMLMNKTNDSNKDE
jgi:5-methylcytosine-specific restriction protein B